MVRGIKRSKFIRALNQILNQSNDRDGERNDQLGV